MNSQVDVVAELHKLKSQIPHLGSVAIICAINNLIKMINPAGEPKKIRAGSARFGSVFIYRNAQYILQDEVDLGSPKPRVRAVNKKNGAKKWFAFETMITVMEQV